MPPKRRNRPGTDRERIYKWAPHSSLQSIESAFSTFEYVQQLSRQVKELSVEDIVVLPSENEDTDKDAWILEQFRQFLIELNAFIIHHADVCTKDTYPEMKITAEQMKKGGATPLASESKEDESDDLVYLCAAFKNPMSVPAMDYMIHTLNQCCTLLHDTKLFPNRISLSSKGKKEIKNQARRLYRLFAFSYFVFPEKFASFEKQTKLCQRYTAFCKKYKIMSKDLFLIPSKALKKL